MKDMSGIFDELNPEQQKAVKCVEGPVLIVAGAGSGKTRVLTSRIAYLIELGVEPDRILALTFTKKAAGEMKERIAAMVGGRKAWRLWMGTFHSIFIRFLREYADSIGFPHDFTIYDRGDSESAVKTCIKTLGLDDKLYKPRDVLARISKAKNDLITPTPYMNGAGGYLEEDRKHKKPEIFKIYKAYAELCKRSGVMDFDDILLYMNILIRGNADALSEIASRFDHILVDEYQDTNYAQYLILRKLSQGHRNICVVGDDSQSIYGFRGAQISNILNFRRDFPGTQLFRLERNYRSTRVIVNAANSVIAKNEDRIPKECVSMGEEGEKIRLVRSYTEGEEASLIASEIISSMQRDKAEYADFALLYRTNSQSRALEEALRKRNIPYIIYSGNSFFERAEVKDMMAYLKLAVNVNDDESFKRIVNKPTRGIGGTSLEALSAAAASLGVSLFRAAFADGLEAYGLKGPAIQKIRSFCAMIERAAARVHNDDAYAVASMLQNESGLLLFYKDDISIEGQARAANVEELVNSVKAFVEERQATLAAEMAAEGEEEVQVPTILLPEFLEDISLLSSVDVAEDETSNKVALMTAHSAKGLEFPYVFVTGMEENLFPLGGWSLTEKDLQEERRLFYVAMTRAKKVVTLTYSETRMRNGKHESNSPSRFLREIAPQYLQNPLRREGDSPWSSESSSPRSSEQWQRPSAPWQRPQEPARKPAPEPQRPFTTPSRPAIGAPKPPEIPNFVPDSMLSFKAGDHIEHNRFGRGLILEISGEVPDLRAIVVFELYGQKILMLKHAKLRHV